MSPAEILASHILVQVMATKDDRLMTMYCVVRLVRGDAGPDCGHSHHHTLGLLNSLQRSFGLAGGLNITAGILLWQPSCSIFLLKGVAGMSFGFLVSSLCDSQAVAMQLSISSFYPNLLLSGQSQFLFCK